MTKKLNILFICNKSPWPASEGGPIAMNQLIEGLANAGHTVKVLAINTNKYSVKPEDIPESYRKKTNIELTYIDLAIKPIPAFLNLFSNKSYHVERFISNTFRKKLYKILSEQKFDVVQLETLFMSPYIDTIRKYSKAKIVLRAHNIEHLIWKRVAENSNNLLKKFYVGHLAKTLEAYERKIVSAFDGIVPITAKDAEFFHSISSTPIMPLPFGVDTEKIKCDFNLKPELALFHIGSMNWIPNEEGIKWFIDDVWPMVEKELPMVKLYLAGREMPDWLLNLNRKNIFVVGEVENAHDFIRSKSISIAPLFSGSGIRIKIIESMALGRTVISTSIGAEGINIEDEKNILIANNAKEYFQAINKLFSQREIADKIGQQARQLIEHEHSTQKLISQLEGFYRQIL
jgi:glycosyltransferase involved in cell wall biosynthesis